MTILKNARHERFATGLADGLSQEKAYIAAGYSPNGARGAACNLLKRSSGIMKRRDELLAEVKG
jgi:phage terminase small subunit